MKKIYLLICIAISSLTMLFVPMGVLMANSDGEKLQIIRFYKLNTKKQQNRLLIREKRLKKTGCQNFSGKKRIYRLTQIGFESCSLYTEKNCPAGTEIEGSWKGKQLSKKFSEGGEWLFNNQSELGELAKSWSCQ